MKSDCYRAIVVVFGQSACIGKICFYSYEWLYSGISGCIRAKVVVFGQSGCTREKVVVFGHRWL